ncbi:DHS-like NAD/FAD-binding domain-containing protein [Armillaria novae-zelandiae]|uniref:DHS-like NAD/FAD-binding domain-containing protein n=1 Tax=Armillaria novae-zelandiae TaxID=153914 RepID=A0AA39PR78_9AGAR|nr:DHS-like NAD/FAD-binding domain-containing protein [Armillaria novae-zelandiae]
MTTPRKTKTTRSSFKVLKGNDIKAVAEYVASKDCRNIIVMLGAGVSTSAGIPDFRSPKTGLYANLARLNLPYPEAVFEINFFRQNPVPFYTLAQELYPGKYRPTLTHSFIRMLASKRLLQTCFTQNIDTLERRAGVPDYKIIEAHGSFASQRCIDCHASYDGLKMRENILNKDIAFCEKCRGLVKPDIVFFGESLPDKFIQAIPSVKMADLLLIIGTSLTVHPFASLAGLAEPLCPRVLVNLEKVGDLGRRPDDVLLLGKCDEVVKDLCRELGWEEELMNLWAETEIKEVETINAAPKAPATFRVLNGNDIQAIAEYMKSVDCRNVIVMLGAGASASAGIPDYRSPETDLYANLATLNLPYPEAIFELEYFRQNPLPFYTLAQAIYPGKYRPTLAHLFIRLLASRQLLHKCFTQNIDMLEQRAGVPNYKVVEARGSFTSQKCIDCYEPYDDVLMKAHIRNIEIAHCEKCGGLVKPGITFSDESPPDEFMRAIPSVGIADLLIIVGTSLTMPSFASLAESANPLCPRVLINLDKVGDLGERADDVLLLGKCDKVIRDLCKELGWEQELMTYWEETRTDEDTKPKENIIDNEAELQTKVDDLVSKIGTALALDQGQETLENEPRTENKDKPAREIEAMIVQGGKLPVGARPTPEDNPVSKVDVDPSLHSDLPADQSSSRRDDTP